MNTSFSGADIMSQLDGFETECNRWEAQSKETFSDTMRIAVVQKGLDDEGIRTHLVMHSKRLSTFREIKEELRNVLATRTALAASPQPMDISALGKGKEKGKQKGKDGGKYGKGKEKCKARTRPSLTMRTRMGRSASTAARWVTSSPSA